MNLSKVVSKSHAAYKHTDRGTHPLTFKEIHREKRLFDLRNSKKLSKRLRPPRQDKYDECESKYEYEYECECECVKWQLIVTT